jgi:hypothetical protein
MPEDAGKRRHSATSASAAKEKTGADHDADVDG